MSEKNPLFIKRTGTMQDKVDALINVVNFLTNEMCEGRVPQVLNDVRATDAKVDDVNATHSIAFVTLAEAGQIDDVTASEHVDMFAEWTYPIAYTVGQLRQYNGMLYKCVQAHTSQEDWTPETAASLWKATSDPAEEFPQWSQPVGAHDAYELGAKVTYNDQHYISTVDGNVWQPDAYGWELVEE